LQLRVAPRDEIEEIRPSVRAASEHLADPASPLAQRAIQRRSGSPSAAPQTGTITHPTTPGPRRAAEEVDHKRLDGRRPLEGPPREGGAFILPSNRAAAIRCVMRVTKLRLVEFGPLGETTHEPW